MSKLNRLNNLFEKGSNPSYKSDHVGIHLSESVLLNRFRSAISNIDRSKLYLELPTTTDAFGNVVENPEESCGIETQPHVTLLYGLDDHLPVVRECASRQQESLTGSLGPISKFENKDKGYDVIIAPVISHNLDSIVEDLQDKSGVQSKFPEYKPHVTLAYVKSGTHDFLLGKDLFDNYSFKVDSIFYHSNKDGKDTSELSLGSNTESVVERLLKACSEGLEVTPHGTLGSTLFISVNGRKYGYNARPNGPDISDIEKTFTSMIKHGPGKALAWLKSVTNLASGSVKGISKLDPARYERLSPKAFSKTRGNVVKDGDLYKLEIGSFRSPRMYLDSMMSLLTFLDAEHTSPSRELVDILSKDNIPHSVVPCTVSLDKLSDLRNDKHSLDMTF